MLMDLAAMLSPQNRRLFKFKNLANPEQELLLESFRGLKVFRVRTNLICYWCARTPGSS